MPVPTRKQLKRSLQHARAQTRRAHLQTIEVVAERDALRSYIRKLYDRDLVIRQAVAITEAEATALDRLHKAIRTDAESQPGA